MSVSDVTWSLEPHTKAKHEILKYYLGAWFAILAQQHPRIIYVDGFAGPGEYKGGEPGSPIIALNVAKNHTLASRFKGELVFSFIEIDEARSQNLKKKLQGINIPDNFKAKVECNSFDICIVKILSTISQRGKQLAPSFFFIDPFGITGFPMSLIQDIAEQPSSEVLVTFNYQPLNRWFLQDTTKHRNLDTLFGNNRWRESLRMNDPKRREGFLRALYQESLEKLGWKVRPFCMINKHNQTQYYLFYATKNPLGMLAMKRAMWKSSPNKDFRYSDLSNPAQPCMLEPVFEEQYSKELANSIWDQYRGQSVKKDILVQDIAWHPVCLKRHLTRALRILEYETNPPAIVEVTNRKKSKTYPEDCVISFVP